MEIAHTPSSLGGSSESSTSYPIYFNSDCIAAILSLEPTSTSSRMIAQHKSPGECAPALDKKGGQLSGNNRFVAFVSGSFASVLVLLSIVDPDAFLHFEITKDRTVLFYITVFGSILAVARGMVPEDHRVVDPEELMKAVIEETHYLPAEWRGKLHSAQVHREFGKLFPLKITTFFQELLSVITTPLVLWFTLPRCAPSIIDFFREFTIYVDGLGHVCSFAVFDFKRHGDVRFGAPVQAPREDLVSEQGKLEKSVLGFKAANPNWQPTDQSTSLYLSKMTEVAASVEVASTLAPRTRRQANPRQSVRASSANGRRFQQGVTPTILEAEDEEEDSRTRGMGRPGSGSHRRWKGQNQISAGRNNIPIHERENDHDESDESYTSGHLPPDALAGIATDVSSPVSVMSGLPDHQPSMMGMLHEGPQDRQQYGRR